MEFPQKVGDQRFVLRVIILTCVLVILIILFLFKPSASYLFFASEPQIGPFTRNLTHLGLEPVELKMHRTVLTLNGDPQPEISHRAVYNAWPKIRRMKAVAVGNSSLAGLPSGPVVGLAFYREGDAREFFNTFPECRFRPACRINRAVFLAGEDEEYGVRMLLDELEVASWYRPAALPILFVMVVAGMIVTVPTCRRVLLTRPLPLSHIKIPVDSGAFGIRTRRENFIILRIGMGLLLAAI